MAKNNHAANYNRVYPEKLTVPITERMHRYLSQPHINKAGLARQALLEEIGESELAQFEPEDSEE